MAIQYYLALLSQISLLLPPNYKSMNSSRPSLPIIYVLIVLSMLFWGMTFIWSTIVFEYYNPIATITIRLFISVLILFIILFLFYRKYLVYPKGHVKWFLMMAFFEPFLYFIGESFGLQKVDPSITAVIISTIPVFTAIVGFYFLKEKISNKNIIGIFVSFSGVILMLLNKDFRFNAAPDGILLLLLAVFSAIGYGILMKKVSAFYHPILIIFIQNTIGLLMFLPLFILFDLNCVLAVSPNFELISSILMLSVFGSSLAFIFYIFAIREIGIAKSNVFTNLIPIFTAVASFFILNEMFTLMKVIGMSIAILGVYLSQIKPKLNN